jgi:hypothetical protein
VSPCASVTVILASVSPSDTSVCGDTSTSLTTPAVVVPTGIGSAVRTTSPSFT